MKIKKILYPVILGLAVMITGCSPEDTDSNGLTSAELDASFTLTPVPGQPNRFLLQATNTENTMNHHWSNGEASVKAGETYEMFLPDIGEYTITHTAVGIGGAEFTSSQNVSVETADPVAGNLIQGGKFSSADDIAQWTVQPMSPDAHWNFANGTATLTSGPTGWAQEGLYQAIQVEGGHEYKFDMKVSGPGWTDSVFELYASYTQPTPGVEYSVGGKVLSLNTWAGCGNSAFTGQLFNISCDSQHGGLVTFPTTGTVYVVMRGGGAGGNFNVTIDNVEVRRND